MPSQHNTVIELANSDYIPVVKDSVVYYGGSQMWFSENSRFSRNYIIHNYGCGTIAAADLFLYLALTNSSCRNQLTESVLQGTDSVYYKDYMNYVNQIDRSFTKTKRWVAVLGPQLASAINTYARDNQLKLSAKWKLSLSFYDMLESMEEMLSKDIPVILSIGPNTPKLWGKKGIPFYQQSIIELPDTTDNSSGISLPPKILYRYKPVKQDINGHYVTVTGIRKDSNHRSIMLHISSWGKPYYINYEEYREYITEYGGTYTSSMVYIK